MRITDRLVSATELNRNSKDVLARATAGARLVVVNNNQPIAAIVPLADLNRLEDLDEKQPSRGDAPTDTPPADAQPAYLRALTAGQGKTVVGQSNSGDALELQVAAHTLVVGATGSGKSGTLSAMLTGFHGDPAVSTRFIVGTGKPAPPQIMHDRDIKLPTPVAAVYVDIGEAGDDVQKFVNVITQSMTLRRRRLRDAQVDSIAQFRAAHPDQKAPDVIVVLDEPGDRPHEDIRKIIDAILDRGAELGFYLWLFAQRGPGHEERFRQRIAHRTDNAATSRALLGSTQARGLQTGECILSVSSVDGDTLAQEFFWVSAPDREPYRLIGLQQDVVDREGEIV